jgi:very-short-patch-repair endonuclease
VDEILRRLRESGGLIERREHRDLAGSLDRALRTGRLTTLLPGIYALPEAADDVDTRILAALLWAGDGAVLTGWSAARLVFWPSLPVETVTVALPTTGPRTRPWLRFERRRIPDELLMYRARFTVTRPCLTAVDLSLTRDGGRCIDQVLRTRCGTLPQMWEALRLTPGRPGNLQRARLLRESRHEPWSELEREAHSLLDGAGIRGWITNAPVQGYFVDVLFPGERLIVELDGWDVHGTRLAFETDRRRRNELVLAGYRVLNFTARQLRDDPAWVVQTIRRALVVRARG